MKSNFKPLVFVTHVSGSWLSGYFLWSITDVCFHKLCRLAQCVTKSWSPWNVWHLGNLIKFYGSIFDRLLSEWIHTRKVKANERISEDPGNLFSSFIPEFKNGMNLKRFSWKKCRQTVESQNGGLSQEHLLNDISIHSWASVQLWYVDSNETECCLDTESASSM